MNVTYKIKTSNFEGPLDLLLHLIEKRKLHINDVSLVQVTDDFINYVKASANFPFNEIADFIVIASTLLLIKSKSLLPVLELTSQEEDNIEDLEKRLKEYKFFKDLSKYIQNEFGKNVIYGRTGKIINPIFSPSKEININSTYEAIQSVILEFPVPEKLPSKTVRKVLSLEDTIDNLIERIGKSMKMKFKDISSGFIKENIIVSFLAVLELVKRGIVGVRQSSHNEDIEISKKEIS